MLYGISYYPEYQPFDRLHTDVAMMADAGINYARIADSIWALCEPVEGQIDVGFLTPTLDALHAADIKVIICTPTYAIPAWLAHTYPEVMNRRADGTPWPYGDRQNVDFTNPTFRFFAERVIRRILERHAGHPAVIGVQVDNETGGRTIHGPAAHDAFVRYLRNRFGTIDRLNEYWGLNFWSHRLADWSQLWGPRDPAGGGNSNPGYDLEWRRFQAGLVTDFLAWQAGIVREYLREDQFVTHDVVGGHGLPNANRKLIGDVCDVSAENFPHHAQDALAHPPVGGHPTYHDASGVHGAYQLYLRGDMARASGRQNFLVTEMNPISVGGPAHNFPAYDGQWRLAAYTCISRGANAVAYWHWHSLHYGSETYSHGVLGHDLESNRCLEEVTTIGHELARVGDRLTDLRAEAEVCFLYSPDSRYLLSFEPCLSRPGTAIGDDRSYQRIFDAFYRAFFDVRAQSTVTHDLTTIGAYPVVVAPAFYCADDASLEALLAYAEAGGHLVLTFRSGYADEYGRARWTRAPGPLRPGVGAGYNLYSNLEKPVPVRAADDQLVLEEGATAEGWMDELVLEGATPLAYYDHHTFGRFPAAVSRRHGAGRVTYVGTLPNAALGRSIARWVTAESGLALHGAGLPEPVRVTRAQSTAGTWLTFLSNWSANGVEIAAPAAGTNLLTGESVAVSDPISLPAWGVEIVEGPGEPAAAVRA